MLTNAAEALYIVSDNRVSKDKVGIGSAQS